jgi:hypothetical protein
LSQSTAGIDKVYVYEQSDLTGVLIDPDTQIVTGITWANPANVKTYELYRELSSYSETLAGDWKTASVYFEGTLSLVFKGNIETIRKELSELKKSEVGFVIKYTDGKKHLIGKNFGCYIDTASQYQSGVNMGDAHGYTFVFKSTEAEPAYFVDDDVIIVPT